MDQENWQVDEESTDKRCGDLSGIQSVQECAKVEKNKGLHTAKDSARKNAPAADNQDSRRLRSQSERWAESISESS